VKFLSALAAGVLFGGGLLLSGMTNPANVVAFLDVTGHWKPALLFTMAAAVAVAAPAYLLAHGRERSLLGVVIGWPDRFSITWGLVVGSAIFGLGWGLSGVCPGPALVLLARPQLPAAMFCAGMVAGLLAAGAKPVSAANAETPAAGDRTGSEGRAL